MKYGSLFAGIGGIDLGLDRAGMECSWQVEIDPYCRKVLAKHWPDVPRFDDIKECGSHNLGQVDLIAGGFPCQDISTAGKGEGINGKRSGLWSEYHRIICELRPRYVLVENVSALLVRGIDRVLGDLASCGYDAEWDCISAASVGAPHRRDRVFIVAYTERKGRKGSIYNKTVPGRPRKTHPFPMYRDAKYWSGVVGSFSTVRGGDGISVKMERDRIRGLGNAVVPQVAEYVGRLIMDAELKGENT